MTSDQNWIPCPQGTLRAIAVQQADARKKAITRRSAVAAVGVVAAGLAYGLKPHPATKIGPLSCRDIIDVADQYVLGQLSPDHAAAVDAHLKKCPACDDRTRKISAAHA